MRQTNSAFALGGIDHCFFRCGLSSFFQSPSYGLVGDILHYRKLDHPVGKEAQTPAGLALRWLATGERYKPCLLLPIELSVVLPVGWASVEGCLQALLEVLLAHPTDGGLAHLNGLCDLLVDPGRTLLALVGFEQDAGVGELASRGCTDRDQAPEVFSFA